MRSSFRANFLITFPIVVAVAFMSASPSALYANTPNGSAAEEFGTTNQAFATLKTCVDYGNWGDRFSYVGSSGVALDVVLVHEARGPSYMVLSLASQRGVAGNETANDTTPSSTRNALRTIKAQHEFVGLAKKFDDARYPRVRDHLGPCLLEDLAPVGFHVAFARGL